MANKSRAKTRHILPAGICAKCISRTQHGVLDLLADGLITRLIESSMMGSMAKRRSPMRQKTCALPTAAIPMQ